VKSEKKKKKYSKKNIYCIQKNVAEIEEMFFEKLKELLLLQMLTVQYS
jgi:hypothetical protein